MNKLLYRNALTLFAAEGFTALATALAGLMAARFLSVTDFGAFSAAFAFAQIMSVLVDSGMGAMIAKKIAHEPAQGLAELDRMFTWRFLMVVIFALFSPLLAHLFLPTARMRVLAMVLTPAVMFLTMTDFISWIFKGLQRVQWCVVLQVGSRTILLALSAAALLSRHPMMFLLAAYGASGVVATLLGLCVLARLAHVARPAKLPRSFFIEVLPDVYKLGAIIILNVVFSRMDVMLVARYCGGLQTGLYGGAARALDGLRMMPTVALGICLPMFSACRDQPAELRSKFLTAYLFLCAASTSLATAGCAFAKPLFAHVLGVSYIASAPLFQPLVWSCVLMYANMLMFALLYALNDHKTLTISALSAIVIDLALNLATLTYFGAIAASWSRLAAEGFSLAIKARGLLQKNVVSFNDLFLKPGLMVGGCLVLLALRNMSPVLNHWAAGATLLFLIVGAFRLYFRSVSGPATISLNEPEKVLENATSEI